MLTHTCYLCKMEKPYSDFHKSSGKPKGIQNRCKKCNTVHMRRWRAENPEKHTRQVERDKALRPNYHRDYGKNYNPPYYAENKDRFGRASAKRRATLSGQPYEDVDRIKILNRDNWQCIWCGQKLTENTLWLEHLIPVQSLSTPTNLRPGHTYANCASACQSCNISRRNYADAWDHFDELTSMYAFCGYPN